MDTQEMIDLILDYAGDHPSFDTEFVDSLAEQFSRKGNLSNAQNDALANIIDRFRMEHWVLYG